MECLTEGRIQLARAEHLSKRQAKRRFFAIQQQTS